MIKCTALFNSVSNISANAQAQTRTGGWSESIYNSAAVGVAQADFLDYCALRAQILPKGFAIIGQRFQIVNGGSSTLGRRYPGNNAYAADVPQVALQMKASAGGAVNVRRWTFRGIPDLMITEGEYLPTSTYKNAVLNAAGFTTGGNWRFFGRNLDNALIDLASITTGGLLTTAISQALNPGDTVQLFRCKDAFGRGVGGSFLVSSVTSPTVLQLRNYNQPAVVEGQIRLLTYSSFAIDGSTLAVERVVIRKVGRPFGGYSGRHSARN